MGGNIISQIILLIVLCCNHVASDWIDYPYANYKDKQCEAKIWKKDKCVQTKTPFVRGDLLVYWRYDIEWEPARISSFAYSMVCACAEAARNASATYFGMHYWGECYSLLPEEIIGEAGDCRLADGNYQHPRFCHENYDEISGHECLAIDNYYLYEVVEEIGSNELLDVDLTLTALPQLLPLNIMGSWSRFPQENAKGEMFLSSDMNIKLKPMDIITWENTKGISGPNQWLGWQDKFFANRTLKYSFWIKFFDEVPAVINQFGMKVYGTVYNDFVNTTCTKNVWCYVERTVVCAASGDTNHVILIFDSVDHKQKVHISNLQLQILKDGSSDVMQTLSALPQTLRLKLMGKWSRFPEQFGPGVMHIGNVTDDKFQPEDIITWENLDGRTGPFQWLGWQNPLFSKRKLNFSFWIKFVKQVPAASPNFGIKVFGTMYNDFWETCTKDVWCYVEKTVVCPTSGDDSHVILIFDAINDIQTVHISKLQLQILKDGSSEVEQTLHALPQAFPLKLMGKWSRFPEHNTIGKVYISTINDDRFQPKDVITWENTENGLGPNQWLGWQDKLFSGKTLKYSFWIEFVDQVPAASAQFGMKVYGTVYNDFLTTCTKDVWCYVEKTVVCAASGDNDHVILIFDTINHKQTVHISRLQIQILEDGSHAVNQTLSALPQELALKVMGKWSQLPEQNDVGKIYVGNVVDDRFQPNDIITWENTAGRPGSYQWLGWQDELFASKTLKYSFWINFVEQVPAQSSQFGMKVYGTVHNEFLKTCIKNIWYYVEKTVVCAVSGDNNHVILIFDSINHTQTVHISQLHIEILKDGSTEVEKTVYALPQVIRLKLMGEWSDFPEHYGVGKIYVGDGNVVNDDTFQSEDMITWINKGSAGPFQWLGWQNTLFAGKLLKISFWIKFVDHVPAASVNFGMKVFGMVYNDFVETCTENMWCYVERTLVCATSGDGNRVILIFDSINHQQTAHIMCLEVQILEDGSHDVMKSLSALPEIIALKIMGEWSHFPEVSDVGKMYVGNVTDDTFQPEEIITWENTAGYSGSDQCLGWQDDVFASKTLNYSFWIKFVEQVPAASDNFGMQVYGTVYNDFVNTCTRDTWCYVERRVVCAASGDANNVRLTFDSINQQQTVHICQFQLQTFTTSALILPAPITTTSTAMMSVCLYNGTSFHSGQAIHSKLSEAGNVCEVTTCIGGDDHMIEEVGCIHEGQCYGVGETIRTTYGSTGRICSILTCAHAREVRVADYFDCDATVPPSLNTPDARTPRRPTTPTTAPTTTLSHPLGCYLNNILYQDGERISSTIGNTGNICSEKFCQNNRILEFNFSHCNSTISTPRTPLRPTTPTTPPTTTLSHPLGCYINNILYQHGEVISSTIGTTGNVCSKKICEINSMQEYNYPDCNSTTSTPRTPRRPTTPTTPPTTTLSHLQGCYLKNRFYQDGEIISSTLGITGNVCSQMICEFDRIRDYNYPDCNSSTSAPTNSTQGTGCLHNGTHYHSEQLMYDLITHTGKVCEKSFCMSGDDILTHEEGCIYDGICYGTNDTISVQYGSTGRVCGVTSCHDFGGYDGNNIREMGIMDCDGTIPPNLSPYPGCYNGGYYQHGEVISSTLGITGKVCSKKVCEYDRIKDYNYPDCNSATSATVRSTQTPGCIYHGTSYDHEEIMYIERSPAGKPCRKSICIDGEELRVALGCAPCYGVDEIINPHYSDCIFTKCVGPNRTGLGKYPNCDPIFRTGILSTPGARTSRRPTTRARSPRRPTTRARTPRRPTTRARTPRRPVPPTTTTTTTA